MFTLIDAAGLLCAIAMFAPLLVLPGYLIGTALNPLGFRAAAGPQRLMLALLLGHAVLPGPLAFVTTLLGLKTGVAVVLALAVCGGAALAMDGVPKLTRRMLAVGCAWLAVLAFAWIDVEWSGRLYQSLVTIDLVKHASITRVIVDGGATPPADPFFARTGKAVFYYFYFVQPAMVEALWGGLIDSRAAVGGFVFWTGIALGGLLVHIYRASGLRAGANISPVLALLALGSGLQIISSLRLWMAQSVWANTQIAPWLASLLWVPHHVAAFIASWMALLLLVHVQHHKGLSGRIYGTLLAAAALASSAGLSIWVTFGTVTAVALWSLWLATKGRWAALATIAAAGGASFLIAAPFLVGLIGTEASGTAPVAFEVRRFTYAEAIADLLAAKGLAAWRGGLNFLLLPLNYLHELGILVAGALAFWLRAPYRRAEPNDVATLLTITTVASLLVGTFLKSAIANNDLGWRVMMFAQAGLLMWTAHVIWPFWQRALRAGLVVTMPRRLPRVMGVFLVLGWIAVAFDIVMLRFAKATTLETPNGDRHAPAVELDLRRAFAWLTRHVDRALVVQHNPDAGRAPAFALYGRQPVGVSDLHNPFILGASRDAVTQRLQDILPLFSETVPRARFVETLKKHGVQLLLITSQDPLWSKRPAWLETVPPLYASTHVRIIAVDRLTSKDTL